MTSTTVRNADATAREYWARVLYDAWPHTAVSPAIAEATGLPSGAVLTFDTVKEAGADLSGLYRYADAILTTLSPTDGATGVDLRTVVIEECAQVAEARRQLAHDGTDLTGFYHMNLERKAIAAAIRSLTPTETGEQGT